jgi:hypothetical protein
MVTAAPRRHSSPAATKYSKPVQRKLIVGASNDPMEREADHIASLVVDGGDGGAEVGTPFATTPLVSRISRSSVIGSEGGDVDGPTERDISSARSGGKGLDPGVRRTMESRIGADFSGVRVHVGAKSDELNRRIQARAFTTGSDIFVRREDHQPNTSAGQRLLAHELVHTVQQGASPRLGADQAQRSLAPIAHGVQRSSAVIQRWDWWEKRKATKAAAAAQEAAAKAEAAKSAKFSGEGGKLADPFMEKLKPGASIAASAASGVGTAIAKGGAMGGGAAAETLSPLLMGDALVGLNSARNMKNEGAKHGDKGLSNLGGRKAGDQGTQLLSASMGAAKGGVDIANAVAKTTTEMGGTALGAAGASLGIAGGSVMVMQGAWRGGHAIMKLCRLTWGRGATMLSAKGEEWKRATLRAEKFKAVVNGLKVAVGVLGIAAGALLIVSNPIGWAVGLAAAIAGGVYAIGKIAGKIKNANDQEAARKKLVAGQSAEEVGKEEVPVVRLSVKGKDREKKGTGYGMVSDPSVPEDPKRKAAIEHANLVAKEACANARTADEMRDALGHGDRDVVDEAVRTLAGDPEFEPGKSLKDMDDKQLYDAFQILSSINVSYEEALSASGQTLIQKKLSKADAM